MINRYCYLTSCALQTRRCIYGFCSFANKGRLSFYIKKSSQYYYFILILILFLLIGYASKAQVAGSITVQGDFDKFYPVVWIDGGFTDNAATELKIGRSSVHLNSSWRGSVIAKFTYHTYNWGNASNFINADIHNYGSHEDNKFIAGWGDATGTSSDSRIIIWLRGGGTTYYYKANYTVSPAIYDGIQHSLPYVATNGGSYSYKTVLDSYVNIHGLSSDNAYFTGPGTNYFYGNIGVGTYHPQSRLSVNGEITAQKVRVTQSGWSDFVFDSSYCLPSLDSISSYIDQYGHLPQIPSASEIKQSGNDLGETDARLLKKIEELTLYLISQNKQLENLTRENKELKNRINKLEVLNNNK